MRRDRLKARTCAFCGVRVTYHYIADETHSLWRRDKDGDALIAFTEHNDNGTIVQVECLACANARDGENPSHDFDRWVSRLPIEKLEDDTLFIERSA